MKTLKLTGLLLSAIGSLSIVDNGIKPSNLNTVSEVFNNFYKATPSRINFPEIAYEKDFYEDCIIEELKDARYKFSHIASLPHEKVVDSLINETFKLNRSLNNNPTKSGKVYLKDINKNGEIGVGKNSGYYFKLF